MERHQRRLIRQAATAATVLALGLAGCAGPSSGTEQQTDTADGPAIGGTLYYRAAGGGRSIDPATTTGYGLAIPLRNLVDSLVFNSIDGEFEPWLAASWEVNADATHYVFHLREDVTFSNEEPLDAEAVKLSYDALRSDPVRYSDANAWIGDLREVTASDEFTVEFHFDSPNSSFLQASSTTVLGIVAPETSALSFDERSQGLSIIGSGPFVATENRNEEGYRLERREDYAWPPESSGLEGPAYLDAIEVLHINDNSIAAQELRSGGLHLLHNTEPADKTAFAASDEITIRTEPLPGAALGFVANLQHPGLQDVEVRRALQLAINRDEVLARASTIDLAPTSVYSAANPYWADASDLITTDTAEAQRLLDEAGWLPGADGIREKDGERLSFEIIYSASTISHEPNLAVVQSQWREIGIELQFGSLTAPELSQRRADRDYAFLWGSGTRPDADVLRSNYGRLDPGLDSLFEQILAEPDIAARKLLAADAADLILTQGYFIPLYDFIQPIAYRNEVNLPLFEATHIPWLAEAWIEEG